VLDGLRMSVTTLTVLPVPGPDQVNRRVAGRAMSWAPLVGLGLGLAAALVMYAARVVQEPEELLPSVLAIGALALLTRGLHLDGLADLADGLGSGRDPEGARAVMKAPDIGPFGVVTLVLVLLVQITALHGSVLESRGTAALVLSVAVGRLAITAACRRAPAAANDGLGAAVAQTVSRGMTTCWTVLLMAGAAGYAYVDPHAKGEPQEEALMSVVAVALALLAAWALRRHAERRVGGITGDVLGAICEVATAVCLVVLACSPSLS
jgi:adenosylcobinamide-GDP ribazoletransferase